MNQKGFSQLIIMVVVGIMVLAAGGSVLYYRQSAQLPKDQAEEQMPPKPKSAEKSLTSIASRLEAHKMPALLNIEVESGVDKGYADKALKGFKIMDFYLNKWFGESLTKKSLIRIEVSSDDPKWTEENGAATYLNRTLSSEAQLIQRLENFGFEDQSRIMAHEYVHLFQLSNGCLRAPRQKERAVWFLEGMADWLSHKAYDESGNLSVFLSNGKWLSSKVKFQIRGSVKPLQMYDLERVDTSLYPYYTSAVDFLMKGRDIKALVDFCVNLGKNQEISAAFQTVFGIPFEKFRSDFEAYFIKTFGIPVVAGQSSQTSDKESQIPEGYSSWQEFCKVQSKDSRCGANKP